MLCANLYRNNLAMNKEKKFACITIKNLWHKLPSNANSQLNDYISFKLNLPEMDKEPWKEWLGLDWSDIEESNAIILAEKSTKNPDVMDGENESLKTLCLRTWQSLQVTGSFEIDSAFLLTGSIKNQVLDIRQEIKLNTWYHSSNKNFCSPLQIDDIEILKEILKKILMIYKASAGDFDRLKRGLRCFQKACYEYLQDYRLPMFVRSIEALIKPEKGNTKKQFWQRVPILCPNYLYPKHTYEDLLKKIYDLRSDLDHLHGPAHETDEEAILLSHKCEEIARVAYKLVILDSEMEKKFKTDTLIDKLWFR